MAQNIVMYANINRNDFANIYKLIRCSFKMAYVQNKYCKEKA